jgi:hypothetical protein
MTKTITNLSELKPGMKTKDGNTFIGKRKSFFGEHQWQFICCAEGYSINTFYNEMEAKTIFIGQEVEVPE